MNLIEIPKTTETWLNLENIEGGAQESRLNLFEGHSLQAPVRSISTDFFYVLC